ncbi:MAG TPA: hypothetical protein VIY27_05050 [Myxococcota bacterium]
MESESAETGGEGTPLSDAEAIARYRAATAMAAVVYAATEHVDGVPATLEAIDMLRAAVVRTLLRIADAKGDEASRKAFTDAYYNPIPLDSVPFSFRVEGEFAYLGSDDQESED